jgi:hypothetical protein
MFYAIAQPESPAAAAGRVGMTLVAAEQDTVSANTQTRATNALEAP